MRFLVISRSKFPAPQEAALPMLDAAMAWAQKYKANGMMEIGFGMVGMQAGGGIANVNSLEELNTMMQEMPFSQFSETEIIPIVDLVDHLNTSKQVAQAMMAAMGGR